MKKKKITWCNSKVLGGIAAMLLMSAAVEHSQAQSVTIINKMPTDEEDIMAVISNGGGDSSMSVIFLESSPQHFNSPDMPRFSIVGKQKQYYLGIGGYVKATMGMDFEGALNSPVYFTPANISVPGIPGNGAKLQYSVATTNMFMHFVGMPGSDDRFSAYVNANFTGAGNSPKLQYAYVMYRGFTAGYSTSLFTDVNAAPPTIDQEGPNGMTFVRTYMLSYKKNWDNIGIGISAEMPNPNPTYNNYTHAVNQRIPDIPAYVQFMWGDYGSRIRLSGLLRNMTYRQYALEGMDAKNKTQMGYGLQLSGNIGLGNIVTFYYQGTYGNGITSYFQDGSGQNLDMFPKQEALNELVTPEAWGGYVGMQFNITERVFASATYSQVRVLSKDGFYEPDYYKGSQYLAVNMFCRVKSNMMFGIEYLWGKRQNMDNASNTANRIQTVARFNF
jgi:hypothetical protein